MAPLSGTAPQIGQVPKSGDQEVADLGRLYPALVEEGFTYHVRQTGKYPGVGATGHLRCPFFFCVLSVV